MSILSASGHATTKASVWQRRWHLTTGAQTVSRSESSAFSTHMVISPPHYLMPPACLHAGVPLTAAPLARLLACLIWTAGAGPRMALDDGRVVSNFVAQALLGQSLTVYGDGQQTRSFQYVSDLINGMVKMMDNDKHIGPFNIGNPNEFTMLELANVVKEVVNPNTEIVFMENTSDDPGRRQVTGDRPMCIATFGICLTHRISASKCRYSNNASYRHKCSIYLHSRSTSTNYCVLFVQPDITKATLHLGWEPKIPLKDGLRMMVTDFRTRLVKLGEKVVV